jgi:hypothetical protein
MKGKTMLEEKICDALFDMYDIRRTLSQRIKNKPKDNDGSIFTVGECIDNVIEFLEQLKGEQAHA